MRAADPVCGADPWGFGNACRRFVAWDGARSQCRHDAAKARHWKLIVRTFQFLFRHVDNGPATDLKAETARVCTCARRTRDTSAVADSADWMPFATETYRFLQRLRKSFSRFAACFRAMGSGTPTCGAVERATTRGSIGAAVLGAEARLSISSFATGFDADCRELGEGNTMGAGEIRGALGLASRAGGRGAE